CVPGGPGFDPDVLRPTRRLRKGPGAILHVAHPLDERVHIPSYGTPARPAREETTMPDHITHDPIYNTVDRDDFASMIAVDRYAERTDAFDRIISATHDHFWDPTDPSYLDFDQPFDLTEDTLM